MEKHYEDLKSKKFFPGLIEYMISGPVVAMVWSGKNVVLEGRKMLGRSPFGYCFWGKLVDLVSAKIFSVSEIVLN